MSSKTYGHPLAGIRPSRTRIPQAEERRNSHHTQHKRLVAERILHPMRGNCIINEKLPAELFAQIFRHGIEMDREESKTREDEDGLEEDRASDGADSGSAKGSEDTDDIEDRRRNTPFEILVSHVCSHWREVALNTTDLWSRVMFAEPPNLCWEKHQAYLDRAKGQPLTIEVEPASPITGPRHYYPRVLDMIVPFAKQWRRFDIRTTAFHLNTHHVLQRLHDIPEAPMLEVLRLQDEHLCGVFNRSRPVRTFILKTLTVPFHGRAPNLRVLDIRGMHLDWDAAIPFFSNLEYLNLGFHVIRPSFETFASYLRNSPKLRFLGLDASGPQVHESSSDTLSIEAPSLLQLSLARHLPDVAHFLANSFHFPNLREMSLNYSDGDYTKAIMAYATPTSSLQNASDRQSVFQCLESLQVIRLDIVDAEARDAMLEALINLKYLRLGVYDCDMWAILQDNASVLEAAMECRDRGSQSREGEYDTEPLLPHLTSIHLEYVEGSAVRKFIEARRAMGRPLKIVAIHANQSVSREAEDWLRENVEEFSYFSDAEANETDSDDDARYGHPN